LPSVTLAAETPVLKKHNATSRRNLAEGIRVDPNIDKVETGEHVQGQNIYGPAPATFTTLNLGFSYGDCA
jgi:hypothetical protein